jgi:hypothetical protein
MMMGTALIEQPELLIEEGAAEETAVALGNIFVLLQAIHDEISSNGHAEQNGSAAAMHSIAHELDHIRQGQPVQPREAPRLPLQLRRIDETLKVFRDGNSE